MEIGHTPPITGLGPAASTWADSPVAGDASVGSDNAPEPGLAVDHTADTAAVQTTLRPQPPATPVHNTDDVLPTAQSVDSDFAAPSSLLVPAMLVGLQVEAAASWPMPWHGFDAPPPRVERDDDREHAAPEAVADEGEAEAEDTDTPVDAPDDAADVQPERDVVPTPEADWCAPLTRTLRTALAGRVPPHALLAAAEQWQRGRCVVLACPQGDDPAGPAWAFVLWPQRAVRPPIDGVAPPLSLHGLRVDARLQWSAPPHGAVWCHVRVVKEHHPRTGRQLVSLDDGHGEGRRPVPCEVQLGPVLARSLRWCEVCVRIQAAQRFWAALGAQWSVHVVVCSHPLIPRATMGDSPC